MVRLAEILLTSLFAHTVNTMCKLSWKRWAQIELSCVAIPWSLLCGMGQPWRTLVSTCSWLRLPLLLLMYYCSTMPSFWAGSFVRIEIWSALSHRILSIWYALRLSMPWAIRHCREYIQDMPIHESNIASFSGSTKGASEYQIGWTEPLPMQCIRTLSPDISCLSSLAPRSSSSMWQRLSRSRNPLSVQGRSPKPQDSGSRVARSRMCDIQNKLALKNSQAEGMERYDFRYRNDPSNWRA